MNSSYIRSAREKAINTVRDLSLDYDLPEDKLEQITNSFAELRNLDDQLQQISIPTVEGSNLTEDFNNMRKNISNLNITDEGARILENLFDETISNVTVYLDDAKNELLADSFMCRPVYETWQSVGTIFCGQIGRPLHGIWLASALISVCLMPLIVLLVGIVKYLFKMDKKYDPKRVTFFQAEKFLFFGKVIPLESVWFSSHAAGNLT
ncbi:unnamed protein product [Gongylonema pulchrum]|uniref:Prominin-1 n=1 Tax=Gongylonema pulchrum TaxID=637853 RepID=A0A183EFS8_9BILA|nr:unnamed protein product [Gongylonema pulchrum]